MSSTNVVHATAPRIRASTRSSSPASLYVGLTSLASGAVTLVGRFSAPYAVCVPKLSASSNGSAAVATAATSASADQSASACTSLRSRREACSTLPLKSCVWLVTTPVPSYTWYGLSRRLSDVACGCASP
ncbi:hypothetical protein [Sorangium cellulosum]|uniref:hypothetical protein n=1 Tax=Sorangium cellulosum TaxID=56 RepID=UPI0005D259AF|nr:hypothetical protein [Sorangium cellulosum]